MGTVSGQVAAPRLHLQGVLLPDGEARDLWVVDGLIRTEPVRDAETVITGAYLMPGLVDAHCHVGLEANGAVPDDVAEQHAVTEREAGALLLRDAGSPADTRWMDDREDLPRLIRAGRHIARPKRYLRNYADEVEPADLVAAVERQAARGDGWIKLVGDWIDRTAGDLTPLWSPAVAKAAIDRAHALGCRVTAHVFGEQAVAELVAAGIDGIEHGTGLDDATIALMAKRQVALVPTMIQLENFEGFGGGGGCEVPAPTPRGSGPCTRAGWTPSAPPGRRACRSTPVPTPAVTCRTASSDRRSPRCPRSAPPSTPLAPARGGPGPGSAAPTR